MRYTYILCVSVAACLSWPVVWPAAAYADLGDQLFKLLADDGEAGDWFGFSVAISGATAIIGATVPPAGIPGPASAKYRPPVMGPTSGEPPAAGRVGVMRRTWGGHAPGHAWGMKVL